MDFTLNGRQYSLEPHDVERALASVEPEEVRQYGVEVAGVVYPVKQALAVVTGQRRTGFQSMTARATLRRLGFKLVPDNTRPAVKHPTAYGNRPEDHLDDPHGWPWEGYVQALFATHLANHGWALTGIADTATKARGVDVLAEKGDRSLGAEVKGWPSKSYADAARRGEPKPTQPTVQAGHWFSQAVMKALMLLDSHPGRESLVVLPDFARYRDLAKRTTTGLRRAGVHVVFVAQHGEVDGDLWSA